MIFIEKFVFHFFFCVFPLLVASEEKHGKVKRVVNGLPITSLDVYQLEFIVMLRGAWGCSGSIAHEFSKCNTSPYCTGSLVTPDFILTACHCSSWDDIEHDPFGWIRFWPYHPLYNGIIIRAGTHVAKSIDEGTPNTQSRHVLSFLPHSLCSTPSYKPGYQIKFNHDIALAKTCEPFVINKFVHVAPITKLENLEEEFKQIVRKGKACLWAGYGRYVENYNAEIYVNTEVLRHMFRYITCSPICQDPMTFCKVCSVNHGPTLTVTGAGDSGCPVVCDGRVFAVHSASLVVYQFNWTRQQDIPLLCIKDYLTASHLSNLKKLIVSKRNMMESIPYGVPIDSVPNAIYPEPKKEIGKSSRTASYSSISSGQLVIFPNILLLLVAIFGQMGLLGNPPKSLEYSSTVDYNIVRTFFWLPNLLSFT